jgi:hypothetical protein
MDVDGEADPAALDPRRRADSLSRSAGYLAAPHVVELRELAR